MFVIVKRHHDNTRNFQIYRKNKGYEFVDHCDLHSDFLKVVVEKEDLFIRDGKVYDCDSNELGSEKDSSFDCGDYTYSIYRFGDLHPSNEHDKAIVNCIVE